MNVLSLSRIQEHGDHIRLALQLLFCAVALAWIAYLVMTEPKPYCSGLPLSEPLADKIAPLGEGAI